MKEGKVLRIKTLQNMSSRVELPLAEAIKISFEQIWKRIERSIIIIGSITCSIALLSYIEMTNIIFAYSLNEAGITIEAYQFWLVIVSLLVCVLGLINANLIAIYERFREIGTMKCLGALDQHIIKLFFIEAFILGLIGGLIGSILGLAAAVASSYTQIGIEVIKNIPLLLTIQRLGLITSLSVILSTISIIYPTLKAVKLNPVEALKYNV